MDKLANMQKIIEAVNLILGYNFGIGQVGERKYACVGYKFLFEYFNDCEWTITQKESKDLGTAYKWAHVTFGGIEFGASVSDKDIEQHNAHVEAIKKQEAVA